MLKNKIVDLRNHLFETLERLLDKDDPLDPVQANAVANVAKVVVETAQVEIDYMRHVSGIGSEFFPSTSREEKTLVTPATPKALTERQRAAQKEPTNA
jgi:hypothetical protein